MKNLINSVLLVTVLSGCSLWPKAHDPALAQSFINTKLAVDAISCEAHTGFEEAARQARWLEAYATFRADPQLTSVQGVNETLGKAQAGSLKVCEHWVKLTKQRLDVLNKAWSGR